jgi:hypothetical protein
MASSDDWLHRFNTGTDSVTATGTLAVERGQSTPVRLVGRLLGLPGPAVAETVLVRVQRRIDGDVIRERWIRTVGRTDLTTRQIRRGDQVDERIGSLQLSMRCHATVSDVWFLPIGAALVLGRWRLRLPDLLAPQAFARAWSSTPDAFDVAVSIRMPLVGTILSYRGHFTEVEK